MGDDAGSSVRVATRIRPQLPREIIDACKICITKTPGEPQTFLGSNKAFTFDYVYDTESTQEEVYGETVHDLIEGCFEGYNATVLAYGQTGSGKTYTMGTGFELGQTSANQGIIPRAVKQLFEGISVRQEEAKAKGQTPPEFKVSTQFMELYNEEIHDLFDNNASGMKKGAKSGIKIHEDSNGNIYTVGVTTRNVLTEDETMQCLKNGAFNRTTASTNMNDQSSRSHAIFTIYIQQQRQARVENPFHLENGEEGGEGETQPNNDTAGDLETLSAKFHFVDLAGSERLKRTGATGDRAKEGISINCGLLALGNVISALGDDSRRVSHVPYRDSKLTRLLQDSLGGNSRTLMIACVSPSDRDFMETLNSLKYANRARNIKNKVTANQDKTSRTIMALRQELQNLQLELMEYKQGKRVVGEDGMETTNDMYHENTMLSKENQNLRTRIKAMQETIDMLTAKNSQLLAEKEVGNWIQDNGGEGGDMTAMVQDYIKQIEELRSKLCESENLCEQLRKETARVRRISSTFNSPAKGMMMASGIMDMSVQEEDNVSVNELIQMAKKELKADKKRKRSQVKPPVVDEDKDADSADDEEDEEDESESEDNNSDSDTEESDNNKANNSEFSEELVELTSEISLKQKLIEELETSQKRLQNMKNQYENKLMALQNRITTTQEERDKVLKNMGNAKSIVPPEKLHKIKQDYQDKLEKLQGEVKKLQSAKKEHAKLLRSQGQYERQVDKLKNEVGDMKRTKVKLVQKMKEESVRHRETELRKNKELSQMRKQTRKNESKIKTLEAEKRMKETVLKRKQEEVTALRRNQRRISMGNRRHEKYSEKQVKQKWQTIEKKITKVALNRQAISQMENDMDRWLKEREKLSRKLERMTIKRKRLAAEKGDSSLVEDLDDQIENLKANVNYLHDNIMECQQNIVEMEQVENPEEEEEEAITKVINIQDMQLEEARYFLGKLLSMTVNQCCNATQKDSQVKELENKISQITHQSTMHQQLLQHMIEQQDLEVYDLMLAEQGLEDSDSDSDDISLTLTAAAPNNLNLEAALTAEDSVGSDSSMGRRDKARRKMTTKEDLLFNDTDVPTPSGDTNNMLMSSSVTSASSRAPFTRSLSFTKPTSELMFRSRSFVKPSGFGYGPPSSSYNNGGRFFPPPDVMTQSVDQSIISRLAPVYQPSPVMGRRMQNTLDRQRSTSPRSSMRKYNSAARLNEESSSSPPGSPPSFRRQGSVREDSGKNVFHRLVAGTKIGESSKLPGKGRINPYQGRIASKSPLICTSVAEGHNKAVLSVFATDELLFSGAKDRTVKVWDLCRKEEVQSLAGHPNNVNVVKYSDVSRLAFTVSSAFIKVWDLRMSTATCIKTLSSSGLTTNGSVQMNSANRTLALPPGETLVNDIALAPSGYSLFSAAGDKVRIWDLRKFHSIGKLSGGHQAAVMCLTTGTNAQTDEGDYVITGSKDHYVKVFNVTDGKGGVVSPTINLDPPHYDGIESLALHGDTLFSASRDTCIKKWNLRSQELVRSVNNAHKDWICGLSFLPGASVVVSGCRAGHLKLWSTDSCALIGEMKAHNSTINTITTNSSHIFTGSNDGSIGMWRVRSNFDRSPDSESS